MYSSSILKWLSNEVVKKMWANKDAWLDGWTSLKRYVDVGNYETTKMIKWLARQTDLYIHVDLYPLTNTKLHFIESPKPFLGNSKSRENLYLHFVSELTDLCTKNE